MRFRYTQEGISGATGKVLLDDYDVSSATHGFTLRSDVREPTTVSLDVVVLTGVELDLEAVVFIPAPVAALLVEFGWTPPPGAEMRGGAMRLQRHRPTEADLLDVLDEVEGKKPKVGGHDACIWDGGICTLTGPCP